MRATLRHGLLAKAAAEARRQDTPQEIFDTPSWPRARARDHDFLSACAMIISRHDFPHNASFIAHGSMPCGARPFRSKAARRAIGFRPTGRSGTPDAERRRHVTRCALAAQLISASRRLMDGKRAARYDDGNGAAEAFSRRQCWAG